MKIIAKILIILGLLAIMSDLLFRFIHAIDPIKGIYFGPIMFVVGFILLFKTVKEE